jgi:hypothetical protein
VLNLGRGVRAYVNLVATACELLYPPPPDKELSTDTEIVLALLGIVTLVARYKGQGSHLLQVIRRDGGIHFLSLVGELPSSPPQFTLSKPGHKPSGWSLQPCGLLESSRYVVQTCHFIGAV